MQQSASNGHTQQAALFFQIGSTDTDKSFGCFTILTINFPRYWQSLKIKD